jgi:hypothetical protein
MTMKRANRKELLELLTNMEEKYFKLVWFARKSPEMIAEYEETKQSVEIIELMYPQEVKDLRENDDNWDHGFNSGCLAAFRFVIESYYGDMGQAMEEFPFLDT